MERTETADLQAAAPEFALGLSSVGVTGVQKAVLIGRGRREKLIAATIDCTVDLDPQQKGVHMSRFPELFEEAIEGVVGDDAFLVEELAEHVARRIVDRQEALLAEVRITAQYPYERRTPVTKLATQEMVSLIGIAAASRERVRRVVGVEATGINACPCAQGLVRGAAAARPGTLSSGTGCARSVAASPPQLEAVLLPAHEPRDVRAVEKDDPQASCAAECDHGPRVAEQPGPERERGRGRDRRDRRVAR